MSRLAGKVALITGGGSGQGRAAALLFAREEARVMIADWDADGARKTAEDISAAGDIGNWLQADVSVEEDVVKVVDRTVELYGRLDVLYANAAVFWPEKDVTVADLDVAVWQQVIDVNLKGVYLSFKHALPVMIRSGGGSIIATSSVAAIGGGDIAHAYTAAKGGVIALTRAVAVTYAVQGVRANVICPGTIETPMTASLLKEDRSYWVGIIPLGRLGTPEDIATTALFLASDESSFITGSVLLIDGGQTAKAAK